MDDVNNVDIPASRCEQVTYVLVGTDVTVTYTELDCFVCTTRMLTAGDGTITFTALTLSVIS